MPLFYIFLLIIHYHCFMLILDSKNCPATNNRRSNYERETGTHQGGNIRLRMQ